VHLQCAALRQDFLRIYGRNKTKKKVGIQLKKTSFLSLTPCIHVHICMSAFRGEGGGEEEEKTVDGY
jgi:hypothetical protein